MEKLETQISRRGFLKGSAAIAGTAALVTLAGCQKESDPEPTPDPANPPEETEYYGTCRGNCGGECALVAKVREGKIVSTFAPEIPGRPEGVEIGCVKGQTNFLRLYGEHRLTHPLKAVGGKGSGQWEKITWDEAIQTIADKMTAAIRDYGPASVGIQHGAGNMHHVLDSQQITIANCYGWSPAITGIGMNRFIQKTGATVFGIAEDQAGMYGCYVASPIASSFVEDFVNAKTLVFWGANPADATFTRESWYWTCKAKEAGAKIVCVDPLYTATAAAADLWLPIRLGTDNMLMCAASKYIIEHGLAHEDILKKESVAPFLIDDNGAFVRLSTLGKQPVSETLGDEPVVWDAVAKDFVAQSVATDPVLSGTYQVNKKSVRTVYDVAVEGIESFTIEEAAEECGLTQEQILQFIELIAKNTPTNLQLGWGVEHTYESWRFLFSSKFLVTLVGGVASSGTGIFQASALTSCRKTVVSTDTSCVIVSDAKKNIVATGDYLPQIMETGKWAGQDLPVRVLYVHASDPLDNASGAKELIEAYKKIDFVVTAEQFMTTTAHWSDMVLPVAMSWETEDFHNSYSFMLQKAIDPIGEARPDFDIIKDIAVAMGYTDLFPLDREGYLRAVLDTPENIAAGVAYDDYHKSGMILQDAVAVAIPPVQLATYGRTPFYVESMLPRDTVAVSIGVKDRMPNYVKGKESYPDNPLRAQYPLFGFSSHSVYHGQSVWAHNALLDEFRTLDGKPYCIISDEAASARGIKTGDRVRATSQHGTCVLNAVVTPGIQKESVWFPHGFYWDEFEEGSAQELTGLNIDPYTSNANFNDFILQVEKL